jgi:hypothetical protein
MSDRMPYPHFPVTLDARLMLGRSGSAIFGRNVLAELVTGIEMALAEPTSKRRLGPVVLGCAAFMDDPALIDALGRVANACIVITKQERRKHTTPSWQALQQLSDGQGVLVSAYAELEELAPDDHGRPKLIGPETPRWHDEMHVGAVREMGYRKVGNQLVPWVHAKLALLGSLNWTDEHPSGHVVDEYFFTPQRLWIGSANFTISSRRSLEVGLWTAEESLLRAAKAFLLGLIELSEPLGKGPDALTPQFLPVEYDDAAIAAYLAEYVDDSDDH